MADVTLAEWQGSVWLVGGEVYIDDLLANTLASEITIEIIPCEHKSEINALYIQMCGETEVMSDPYMIHPAIVNRIRRATSATSVFFAEWSAAFDKEAGSVIRASVQWALANPTSPIELVAFLDPAASPALAGIAAIRSQLIADAMIRDGVSAERITQVTREPASGTRPSQDSQRIDIAVKQPDA